MFINSYLESKNEDIPSQFANFVESFEVLEKQEKSTTNLHGNNLIDAFKKLQEKSKLKVILSYKRKRPPQLDASSVF
jgi:hypothetical protein